MPCTIRIDGLENQKNSFNRALALGDGIIGLAESET